MVTLQDAILRLQSFWAEQGCLIWQPMNTEVGAGTMNPATFLRVLGPRSWRVGYVEPSVRPDDSRYGDNPNRVQTHLQFQVVLKPDTGEPQEQYLESLEALGIDTRANDLRFVEDNWESPALGAWGLGWEVWLNGLEITQFTYFQQAGGLVLDPPSVEITYGLERILMAVQGVEHFKEIRYSDQLTYGALLGRAEYEMSVYYLDAADTTRVRRRFEIYEEEARSLLDRGLILPAYSYVLKTSHAFNVLDARGVVGVTERAGLFARMRELSRRCATLWVEQESEETHPSIQLPPDRPPAPVSMARVQYPPSTDTSCLAVEIGTEEMPSEHLRDAISQLRVALPSVLAEEHLTYEALHIDGTPRRLVMIVDGLAARQPDVERVVRGPRADVAWDASGTPTRAATGFAERNGTTVSQVRRELVGTDEFAALLLKDAGRPAADVLADRIPALLEQIRFARSMRWNETGTAFSRPVRWVLALLGTTVVPFEFAGLRSDRVTYGMREGSRAPAMTVQSATDVPARLAAVGIMLDAEDRRQRIWHDALRLAREVGGDIRPTMQAAPLPEIANLVEQPETLRGEFDKSYLELPDEVLSTVMIKHQRYLPIHGDDGLLPYFVAAANGARDIALVRRGNEAVLRARFADALFFYGQDRQQALEAFRDRLSGILFHEALGSMRDKADRIEILVAWMLDEIDVDPAVAAAARRAAHLAKDDLATSMVIELTTLAGIMGAHYAAADGEPPDVAMAIRDHVRPGHARDDVPTGLAGALVGVADRLDSIVGLIAVGVRPKGSRDPFALRRAALGMVQILTAHDIAMDLGAAIQAAAHAQPVAVTTEAISGATTFILRRFEQWERDAGHKADEVRAVLAGQSGSLAQKHGLLDELAGMRELPSFMSVQQALSRANRISRNVGSPAPVNPALFEHEAEQNLWEGYLKSAEKVSSASSLVGTVSVLEPLAPAIDRYFEDVLVMADDPGVAANRLALLWSVAQLPAQLLDFQELADVAESTDATEATPK